MSEWCAHSVGQAVKNLGLSETKQGFFALHSSHLKFGNNSKTLRKETMQPQCCPWGRSKSVYIQNGGRQFTLGCKISRVLLHFSL